MNIRAGLCSIALLVLVACSARSLPPFTPPHDHGDTISSVSEPQPLDPSAPDSAIDATSLHTDSLLPAIKGLNELHGRRTRLSVAVAGDHEDAGIGFNGNGRYTSLFAVHEIHPYLQLSYPSGATGNEFVFAPTTKDGCLENVTVYVRDQNGPTQVQFAVFDWCNTFYFIGGVNVDAAFVSKYVRMTSSDSGIYATEIYTHDRIPHAGTRWYSLLYNFETHRWNSIEQLTQQTSDVVYNGWSIFETYLQPGPCPDMPQTGAGDLSLYDTVRHRWRLISPSLPDLSTGASYGPPGSCFVPAPGPGVTYKATIVPDYAWSVTSTE